MPFAIKIGGETHKPQGLRPIHEDPARPETHAGFLLWDHYIGMLQNRYEAVQLWMDYEAFGEQIDQRGVDHPKFGKALGRLFRLENRIIQEQISFLTYERYADRLWRGMLKQEREDEGVAELYNVSSDRDSLLGLWYRDFGSGHGATCGGFPVHPTAFMVATKEQSSAYAEEMWRRRES